jgi:hypothetical protein
MIPRSIACLRDPSPIGFTAHANQQTHGRAPWMAMAAVDREEVLKNSELAGIGFGAWREMQQQGQRRRDAGG